MIISRFYWSIFVFLMIYDVFVTSSSDGDHRILTCDVLGKGYDVKTSSVKRRRVVSSPSCRKRAPVGVRLADGLGSTCVVTSTITSYTSARAFINDKERYKKVIEVSRTQHTEYFNELLNSVDLVKLQNN